MKAIDKNKTYEFVVQDERGVAVKEEDRTVFLCHYLGSEMMAALGDSVYSVKGVGQARRENLNTGTQQLTILKECLVGWRNMRDEDGKEVTFDEKNKIDMIDMIPPKYRSEIADFIRGESEVNEGEG